MTEPLRGFLTRAADVWGARVQKIDWKRHKLKEPQERVREASPEEEEAVLAAMPEDYRPALAFAIMTGCRRAEIVGLTWQNVDFFNREIRVLGKGDRSRTIPMTTRCTSCCGASRTTIRRRSSPTSPRIQPAAGYAAGAIPSPSTASRRCGTATAAASSPTSASTTPATPPPRRIVRATGNLKMAQHLLGHTSVTTTARYAHVTHDDLRQGMEAAARAKSATRNATDTVRPTGKN